MKKLFLFLCLTACITAVRANVFDINLNATNDANGILSGLFQVPVNGSTATGGEVGDGITYDNATMSLTLNIAYGLFGFQPLTSPFAAAHLHEAPAGVNGPVIINLASIHTPIGTQSGFFSGTFNLTYDQESALFANQIYMNIHSTAFPGGEIRAQLIPSTVPEPSVLALTVAGLGGLLLWHRKRAD